MGGGGCARAARRSPAGVRATERGATAARRCRHHHHPPLPRSRRFRRLFAPQAVAAAAPSPQPLLRTRAPGSRSPAGADTAVRARSGPPTGAPVPHAPPPAAEFWRRGQPRWPLAFGRRSLTQDEPHMRVSSSSSSSPPPSAAAPSAWRRRDVSVPPPPPPARRLRHAHLCQQQVGTLIAAAAVCACWEHWLAFGGQQSSGLGGISGLGCCKKCRPRSRHRRILATGRHLRCGSSSRKPVLRRDRRDTNHEPGQRPA